MKAMVWGQVCGKVDWEWAEWMWRVWEYMKWGLGICMIWLKYIQGCAVWFVCVVRVSCVAGCVVFVGRMCSFGCATGRKVARGVIGEVCVVGRSGILSVAWCVAMAQLEPIWGLQRGECGRCRSVDL